MSRYQKKYLRKTIALLEETNRLIGNNGHMQQTEVRNALIQCQEAALEMGSQLETRGEPGIEIVPLLEEYCESLYQMSQSLEDSTRTKKMSKYIRSQLLFIRDKIEKLPAGRREVVFFPYKAAMWDSLESVWRAASNDETCDVYVVPIPYFDKNPDGSFDEMHYEGEMYPADVPVISWKEYRLAERYPDVVYIHNPYDQYNHVTSVHPDFYAAALKRYADLLVYIPYFVATMHRVKEDFCTLPGVFYADRVIVEDEEIRKFYIACLHTFEKKNHCKGAFGKAEEKILALGSPKFDKVLSTRREDITIPPEWDALIYRKNGTRKKVVLYNTTIDSLLRYEDYVKKIDSVLKAFYEKREDIVLLWRPHPLNETTMQAMRPQRLEAYKKAVANYRAEGYGIYDDTADLHRAIALSDAYYGDWSSIVSLYEKTGKPVLIQNHEVGTKPAGAGGEKDAKHV